MATHVRKTTKANKKPSKRAFSAVRPTEAERVAEGRISAGRSPHNAKGKARSAAAEIRDLFAEYELNRRTLARMLGVADTTLSRWQTSGKVGKDSRNKIKRVAEQLRQLRALIPTDRFPAWLTTPNDACLAAGGNTPVDLMELGKYDKIDQFIYLMGSGVAF